MEIEINIQKKFAMIFIGLLVVSLGVVTLNAIQNPGHNSGEMIKIKIPYGPGAGGEDNIKSILEGNDIKSYRYPILMSQLPWVHKPYTPFCYRKCGNAPSENIEEPTGESSSDPYTCNENILKSMDLSPPTDSNVYACFLQAIVIAPSPDNVDNVNSVAGVKKVGNNWVLEAKNSEYIITCLSREGTWNPNDPAKWLDCRLNS